MKKAKNPKTEKKKEPSQYRWATTVFLLAVALSAALSLASESMLSGAGLAVALLILGVFIALGIVFDIIGVAVTAADPRPFHSMAAHKEKGAKEALNLLRNASHVSSVCNDVVGDICGVVSGAASATIAARAIMYLDFSWPQLVSLGMSALVAGLTVGGKAIGKTVAMNSCTEIVFLVGQILATFDRWKNWPRKKITKKKG